MIGTFSFPSPSTGLVTFRSICSEIRPSEIALGVTALEDDPEDEPPHARRTRGRGSGGRAEERM